MKHKLRTLIIALTMLLLPAGLVPMTASAACSGNNSAGQVLQGIGQTGSDCTDSGVSSAVSAVVKVLSFVAGAIAVIMIIVSAFKYITSGGDSNRVSSAKTTLIYALIGIAIAALAQILVNFVITQSNNVAHCPAGQHLDSSSKCVKN